MLVAFFSQRLRSGVKPEDYERWVCEACSLVPLSLAGHTREVGLAAKPSVRMADAEAPSVEGFSNLERGVFPRVLRADDRRILIVSIGEV